MKIKKIVILILSISVLLSCFVINTYAAENIRSVYINPLKKASPGQTYQITYTVNPSNASYEVKSWSVDSSCGTISQSGLLKIKSSAKAGKYKVSLCIVDKNTKKEFKSSLYIEVKTGDTVRTTAKTANTTKSTTQNTTTAKVTVKETTTKKTTTENATETTKIAETVTKIETTKPATTIPNTQNTENKLQAKLGKITIQETEDGYLQFYMTKVDNIDGYILYITHDGEAYKQLYSGQNNTYISHMIDKSKKYTVKYAVYKSKGNAIEVSDFSSTTVYK